MCFRINLFYNERKKLILLIFFLLIFTFCSKGEDTNSVPQSVIQNPTTEQKSETPTTEQQTEASTTESYYVSLNYGEKIEGGKININEGN